MNEPTYDRPFHLLVETESHLPILIVKMSFHQASMNLMGWLVIRPPILQSTIVNVTMIGSRVDKDDQIIKMCCIALMKHEVKRTRYSHSPNYMNKSYVKILTRMRMYQFKILQYIGCQPYIKQILT